MTEKGEEVLTKVCNTERDAKTHYEETKFFSHVKFLRFFIII
jgi:hypothetical protein